MNHQWMAYVIVALLAIGAGVGIAGLPNNVPVDATIIPPTTTVAPEPTPPTTPTIVPETTEPSGSTTTTTVAPTTVLEATTTTTTPGDGVTTVTTTTTTTTTAPPDPGDDLRQRATLDVGVANGGAVNGLATATAGALDTVGYSAVQPVDTENPTGTTTVYYEPGFQLEAARLASDLGWDPIALAPIADMPPLATTATFQLVAMIGLDNAPPP